MQEDLGDEESKAGIRHQRQTSRWHGCWVHLAFALGLRIMFHDLYHIHIRLERPHCIALYSLLDMPSYILYSAAQLARRRGKICAHSRAVCAAGLQHARSAQRWETRSSTCAGRWAAGAPARDIIAVRRSRRHAIHHGGVEALSSIARRTAANVLRIPTRTDKRSRTRLVVVEPYWRRARAAGHRSLQSCGEHGTVHRPATLLTTMANTTHLAANRPRPRLRQTSKSSSPRAPRIRAVCAEHDGVTSVRPRRMAQRAGCVNAIFRYEEPRGWRRAASGPPRRSTPKRATLEPKGRLEKGEHRQHSDSAMSLNMDMAIERMRVRP